MNSDIGNWINYLNKSLASTGEKKINKMVVCKGLKLTSLSVLKDFVKKLKGKQLTKKLLELKLGFDIAHFQIKNENKLSDIEKLPFLAICQSLLELIQSTNEKAVIEGQNFNCVDYFTKYINDLTKATTNKKILNIIGSDESVNTIEMIDDKKLIASIEELATLSKTKTKTNTKTKTKTKLSKFEDSDKVDSDSETEYEPDSEDEDDESDEEDDEYDESDESDESDDEDDEDDEEYDDDDEEDYDDDEIITRSKSRKRGMYIFMNKNKNKKRKIDNKEDNDFLTTLSSMIENNGSKGLKDPDEREQLENKLLKYFSNFNDKNKNELLDKFKNVLSDENNIEPLLFKIVNLNIPTDTKNDIVNEYLNMEGSYSDKAKLKSWLENVIKLPFGKKTGKDFSELTDASEINTFIKETNRLMNEAVYGHDEAKKNIIQIMVQYITNPSSSGSCIGIWGPPGNGKTTLIKEGVTKAMGREFVFISLGGASDASYLDGHSFTYEGSIYGRIAQGLMLFEEHQILPFWKDIPIPTKVLPGGK